MRKLIPLSIAGAVALLATGGAVGAQALDKTVELSVDGVPTTVTTYRGDVGELLAQQGITVGEHDVVAPAASTQLDDGDRISVQYGREVTVEVDGKKETHWTTATSVGEALAVLAVKAQGADLSTSRSTAIGREGLSFSVDTVKAVTLVVGTKKSTVTSTAGTVAEVLSEAKVKLDKHDTVTPKVSTALADGDTVTVVDGAVADVTKKTKIEHKTVRQETSSLTRGTTRVQTEGRDGERTTVVTETRENGKVVKTKEKSSKVTKKAVDEVILVGTGEVAKPKPSRSSGSSSSGGSSSGGSSSNGDSDSGSSSKPAPKSSGSSAGVWDKLAKCESGGNWSINTGNGYYGGLQFSLQTWKAFGGSGMPHENSKSAQIAVAEKIQASQGWGAWPSCSSKLGLR